MKSGERTDKADGHIQERLRFLPGSKVSPPTHPKTNKFCDVALQCLHMVLVQATARTVLYFSQYSTSTVGRCFFSLTRTHPA